MKKVLMVIHDMRIGGAQKSLLSFLQCFYESRYPAEYEISLLVIDPQGPFMAQIPEGVRLLTPAKPLRWAGSGLGKNLLLHHFSLKSLMGEGNWLLRKATKAFPKAWNLQQKLWDSWNRYIPAMPEHFDIAVSYMDGIPNYYVTEKASADRKILWVHSEYRKQGYAPGYDLSYFQKADGIITISQNCKNCIVREFPDFAEKVHILENITAPGAVLEKSRQGDAGEFDSYDGLKLLTVARLNPQKGVDLGAESAKILKNRGIAFRWLVVGDGPERENLRQQIEQLDIGDCFLLLGSRENPYGYMAQCHILVQPSRVEGKSIVLDEAKVLCKPIVATNYTTVGDSLTHGRDGWVVDMNPEAIAEGVLQLWENENLRRSLGENLQASSQNVEPLLRQYLTVMF